MVRRPNSGLTVRFPCNASIRRLAALFVAGAFVLGLPSLVAWGQPPREQSVKTTQTPWNESLPASPEIPTEPAGDAPALAEADPPEESHRKEGIVTAAVFLLGGVAAIGASLIGMVVLWGFRVRRTIRQPLPKTAKPDELWYLRAKAGLPPESGKRTAPPTGASDSSSVSPGPSPHDA